MEQINLSMHVRMRPVPVDSWLLQQHSLDRGGSGGGGGGGGATLPNHHCRP